ncbi:capsule assembly Wzi family protein [Leeuwenhoekiella palythoae]|uniref:Capsule assembly protein Wzi n=1 Tax=Leeuwenhoekiella palythoae TaxID=573501 RepID=A0A1M5UFU6_9FLAO|nr:capsule assembly Wzi family protein [Leeuwenhoekiella palythoae]RXG27138.1 capsule assembly protein Wzi [Leeuwenhoekiella palythoae]SHH61523.1 Capsule assembly protein Wzi [Leeuwenhoekiella palythoae]
MNRFLQKRINSLLLTLTLIGGASVSYGQAQELEGLQLSISGRGLAATGSENPFWMYSNQYGRLDAETNVLGLAQVAYATRFNENHRLEIGGGLLANDGIYDGVKADELYATYTWKWIEANAGLKHRERQLNGISSVDGDIVWSNNARALPGIYIRMLKPLKVFKWLEASATFGHYFLEEDRYVSNAQVHHKSLELALVFSPGDRLSGSMKHYVQFGGTSPVYGEQPTDFKNLINIFFGQGASAGSGAFGGDQINSLGNGLGSYELAYEFTRPTFYLKLYHQSLFEDTSGIELSNFPDGVWGAYLEPEGISWLDALDLEYVQTVSQSGRFGDASNGGSFSGGDSYFWNGIYQSGWNYQNRIIGLPFIIPGVYGQRNVNDRSYVVHLGATGSFGKLQYRGKLSYVTNLGTYNISYQPREHALYSYGELRYATAFGVFTGTLGLDWSDRVQNTLGVGLGYRYNFSL